MIWKPSPTTPLTAIAVQHLVNRVTAEHKLEGVFNLCIGADAEVGRWMAEDRRLPLISATGSCAMGRSVAQTVGARLGRDVRTDSVCDDVPRPGRSDHHAQSGRSRSVLRHLYGSSAKSRAVSIGGGQRLRHREREHRHVRRGDRRCLRRREGHGWRSRIWQRCLEVLHAPPDLHDQLRHRSAAGPGRRIPASRIAIAELIRGVKFRVLSYPGSCLGTYCLGGSASLSGTPRCIDANRDWTVPFEPAYFSSRPRRPTEALPNPIQWQRSDW